LSKTPQRTLRFPGKRQRREEECQIRGRKSGPLVASDTNVNGGTGQKGYPWGRKPGRKKKRLLVLGMEETLKSKQIKGGTLGQKRFNNQCWRMGEREGWEKRKRGNP